MVNEDKYIDIKNNSIYTGKVGRPRKFKQSKLVALKIDPEMYSEILKDANELEMSFSAFMRFIYREYQKEKRLREIKIEKMIHDTSQNHNPNLLKRVNKYNN